MLRWTLPSRYLAPNWIESSQPLSNILVTSAWKWFCLTSVCIHDESVEPVSTSAMPFISTSCRFGETVSVGVPVRSHAVYWLPDSHTPLTRRRGLADMRKFIDGPPSDQVRPPLKEAFHSGLMSQSMVRSAVCDSAFSRL